MSETLAEKLTATTNVYLTAVVARLVEVITDAGFEIEPSAPIGLMPTTIAYGTAEEIAANKFRTIELIVELAPVNILVAFSGTIDSGLKMVRCDVRNARLPDEPPHRVAFNLRQASPEVAGERIWAIAPEAHRTAGVPTLEMLTAVSSLHKKQAEARAADDA